MVIGSVSLLITTRIIMNNISYYAQQTINETNDKINVALNNVESVSKLILSNKKIQEVFISIKKSSSIIDKVFLLDNDENVICSKDPAAIPFNLLLLRTFLIGIPKEIEEASRVDGCNEIRVFISITMPLAKPIMTTVILLVFVTAWNEFLMANTFLTDDSIRTVATRFVKFTGEWTRDMAKIFTAGAITLIPIIILYIIMQKKFIEGMTKGGLKG